MDKTIKKMTNVLIKIISETNGLSLANTIELLGHSTDVENDPKLKKMLSTFVELIFNHRLQKIPISSLLEHPFSKSMFYFLKKFPLKYHEEHIHLTGSLTPEFIYPRLMKILNKLDKSKVDAKLKEVYGDAYKGINSPKDIEELICLKNDQSFKDYLRILYLPKLILTSKEAHKEAANHMAENLYHNYNVGKIRLKFTLSRVTGIENEILLQNNFVKEEDVVLGLFEGFMDFKKKHPDFEFILSPCFRKENDFYNHSLYNSKEDDFENQIEIILKLIEKYPYLNRHLCEVDTVGDERLLFRKKHFAQMKHGFRRLQYKGFKIRSHHGESFQTLRKGVQSVDNAMNIWRIDTLEHGISLGINPNYYYQSIVQETLKLNELKKAIPKDSQLYAEIIDFDWHDQHIKDKLLKGIPITQDEKTSFTKTKFHTALETEQYQHDVLNHMINKNVALISLPTSNLKLTGRFHYYKDHPFSWWEKKGVGLGIGTDNYITLKTNFIQELLILLYSDPENLKITKLLRMATREKRRPYISNLLWSMRKNLCKE